MNQAPQGTPVDVSSLRSRVSGHHLTGLVCALLVGLCILVACPVLEMGTNDDWSYIRTSLDLARTGHLIYNGWATAMLGWQVYWGALFVKVFGASFLAVRLSTLPLAMASGYQLYQIFIWFGINTRNAVLGTLTIVLSPVFLPLAASFMTDVPGFFLILLSLYACLKALDAKQSQTALGWLAIATVVSVAGGTARQTVWLGALVIVPSTAWLLRHSKGILAGVAVLWIGTVIAILAVMHWYGQQPYAIPEKFFDQKLSLRVLPTLAQQGRDALLTVLLIILPVLTAYLAAFRRVSKKLVLAVFVAAILVIALRLHGTHSFLLAPWLPNMVTEYGVLGSGELENLGTKPIVLGLAVRVILTLVIFVATSVTLASLFNRALWRKPARALVPSWYVTAVLLGPLALAYIALLTPRAAFVVTFDRYLIPLSAFLLIPLLRFYQEHVQEHGPRFSFGVLALFAGYGVASTHDYFATNRARLQAAENVRNSGVPRTLIQGGWEYDSWTQLQIAGYVNDWRIEHPAHAYREVSLPKLPEPCRFRWSSLMPTVTPRYFVVFSPQACLAPSSFAPVRYHTWLPPFQRQIEVQQLP